jgi:hypothetical protein
MNRDALLDAFWAEVQSGRHDTSSGIRPVEVFVDRDGDIAVAYPAGPNWTSWEQKVARPD